MGFMDGCLTAECTTPSSPLPFPLTSQEDVIIYEMNVRAFTADESSGLAPELRGSYLGVAEKVNHCYQ